MYIDRELCNRCAECIKYCPVGAIQIDRAEKRVHIVLDDCVECGVCKRAAVCPTGALQQQELVWPRTIRSNLSDPLIVHKETRIPGRGTEEIKTNDVTGRYRRGHVGIAVEMGRPGTSTSFVDVQTVASVLARLGVRFEPQNPLTVLMADKTAGTFPDEVLGERALSAIIEFDIRTAQLPAVIDALQDAATQIDTLFSLGMCSLVEPDGTQPFLQVLRDAGIAVSHNGKTNVGLGRPAFDFGFERAEAAQ
jgi:NAD-dependent dihydropyrimidine dehydrogenase PreA subunit